MVRLQPGQTLLHYRLVEQIGAGGMGEVWSAVDTQLDREVAIKVLPAACAGDPERIARLEREAKLLASLSHPNIAAIYGFPCARPSPESEETIRFLAMEMVRGEDLSQLLARGPLPINEVLDAARQIAGALEAAHDSGVIHRDLKPANVRRTPGGEYKVLDFGLAKALEAEAPPAPDSATVTSAGSVAGMILGTASYMSPEQARGQPVDRRTDLWAFGCLLYEMLTGERAFAGATVTDVLAAVLTGEPDWNRLPAATPLTMRRLLRRCLEKNAKKRLKDAGDASLLLDENPEDAGKAPVARARPAGRWLLAAIVAAAVLAGAAIGWGIARRGAGPAPARASDVEFQQLTFARGMMRAARFAPDGQTIVYGAAWDGPPVKLYLVRVDAPESSPIALPPGELLAVSRTGEMAVSVGHAYVGWMGQGTLARTSLLGGSPREILEHVRVADWSPDGSQLAIVRRVEGFDRLEYPIGTVLYQTAGYVGDVRVSPDGQRIAFTDHPVYSDDRGDLAVVDLSGQKTTLHAGFASIRGIAWAPGGEEIWFTAFDGRSAALLASDLAGHRRVVHPSISNIELFDIAPDGRVLLASQISQRQVQALLAGYAEPRNLIIPGESTLARALSPDGRLVLVSEQLTEEYSTYLVRADRPGATRLSSGDAVSISPDGRWGLSISADAKSLYLSPLGAGQTRTITQPGGMIFEGLPAWLPDGQRIVIVGRRGSEESRAFVYDIESGAMAPFGQPGVYWLFWALPPISPDGRYVVLQDARGTPMRWPVEGGDPLPIPGLTAEDLPLAWCEDGAALFVGPHAVPMPISRLDLSTGRRTPWITIAPTDTAGLRIVAATITPNGKYWLLSTGKLLTDLYVVGGLR